MGSRGASSGIAKASASAVLPTGIKGKGTIQDIAQLAIDYNAGDFSDKQIEDVLMGYEVSRGENYDDMYDYFAGLTGKRALNNLERQDEITARLQTALKRKK